MSSLRGKRGKSFLALTQLNHAKAAFLLIPLPELMDGIVGDLQTKANIMFKDVHAQLLDIDANYTLPSREGILGSEKWCRQ